MSKKLENYIPAVKFNGINTAKNIVTTGTITASNITTSTTNVAMTGTLKSGGVTELALTAKRVIGYGTTTTDLDAQSGTAAIAELLGGIYTHNSKTGAGTLTTPTGTEISAGISNVAVGYTFDVLYYNRGNQTVTLTAGASGVTMYGTVAVPTLKCAVVRFVCTAANTWKAYVNLSA